MPALYGWLSEGIAAEQWDKTETAKGETVLSKLATEATFIAEYNFRLDGADAAAGNGMVEAVFSYTDASNYSAVILLPSKHELHYITVKNGSEQHGGYAALPSDFDYSKLHTIRVERRDDQVLVFFDGMKKLEEETAGPGEGKIGYFATNVKPIYEYTAFANDAGGSSDFEAYKPVPGMIEAVHYLKEAERGFHVEQKSSEISAYRAADGVPIQKSDDGSYSVTLQQSGDWLKYKLNAKADAKYGIGLALRKPEKDIVLEWSIDGGDPVKTKINADDPAFTEDTAKLRIGTLDISAGFHELKLELKSGAAVIQSFELFTAEQLEEQQSFEQLPVQSGFGLFGEDDHAYTGSGTEDDRLFAGSDAWDDYTFSVGVKLNADTDIGGLFIRETNESYHPAQVRDAAMGYYIGISSSQLTLHRLNYDSELITSETVELEPGRVYTLKAAAKGGTIQVFLNDDPKPLIQYTDPQPFLYGKVGIHAERSTLSFYDLIVKPLKK